MCRTKFLVPLPNYTGDFSFFADMPARVVTGDAVTVWPLLPVELAAQPAQDWLRQAGLFAVSGTCWSRDEHGIFLAAMLSR